MPEGERRDPEATQSVLEEKDMKRFIERRKISPEDFPLIERLAQFPSDLVIGELHNTFNMLHERAVGDIEERIRILEEQITKGNRPHAVKSKELLETMLQFARKYDWETCYTLVRIIEERRVPWRLSDFIR